VKLRVDKFWYFVRLAQTHSHNEEHGLSEEKKLKLY